MSLQTTENMCPELAMSRNNQTPLESFDLDVDLCAFLQIDAV